MGSSKGAIRSHRRDPVDDRHRDSTARARELGDGRWRELLTRHNMVVRRLLQRFRGREITTTGDGLVAAFDGAERAISAAQEIGRARRR